MGTLWVAKDSKRLHADTQGSYQTARMFTSRFVTVLTPASLREAFWFDRL